MPNKNETLPAVVATPQGNYIKYTGEETIKPTLKQYIEARANEARVSAVGNALTQKHPVVPTVPNLPGRAYLKLFGAFGATTEKALQYFGSAKHPHTCMATTTTAYNDPGAYYAGNKSFVEEQQAFVPVALKDAKRGDALQLLDNQGDPYHMTMVTGFTKEGDPVLTYSNGGIDKDEEESHMRYQQDNLYDDGNDNTPDFGVQRNANNAYQIWRYIGSPEMRKRWAEDYKALYKAGGPLVQRGESGIHIKPENKGKFNATKTRTGKTTEELTHSKNPITRRRAVFAQNAAK